MIRELTGIFEINKGGKYSYRGWQSRHNNSIALEGGTYMRYFVSGIVLLPHDESNWSNVSQAFDIAPHLLFSAVITYLP